MTRYDVEVYRHSPFGQLMTPCWCERHAQSIPADMVRRGRTWCCGASECREMAVAA